MADSSRGTYWITTFGCQMNKADSERMAGILESMGYSAGDGEDQADLAAVFKLQQQVLHSSGGTAADGERHLLGQRETTQ